MASRDKIIAKAEKLVSKGKIEDAIGEYERLLKDSPNDVNTLNRIGDLWVRINRPAEAVGVFSQIADHYSRDGFFLKAIAIYKKINKLDPSRLDVYEKLAELYAKQGLAMEAKSQFLVLADYSIKQGNTAAALKTYKKISELDPNSINIHVKLADLYQQNGQTSEALKQYDRVGRLLLKKSMFDEAVQVFQKAVKIDASNVELVSSLVSALNEAGQHSSAIQILETAQSVNPESPELSALLGRALIGKGDLAEAQSILEQAVAVSPDHAGTREALAQLYLRKGDGDQAFEMIRPRVDALLRMGDATEAVGLLNTILSADATHPAALEKLVEAHTKANQETHAIAAMNSLAEAHLARGDSRAAVDVLEKLVAREPQNEQYKKKLAFVQQQSGMAPPAAPPSEPALKEEQETEEVDFGFGEAPAEEIGVGLEDTPEELSLGTEEGPELAFGLDDVSAGEFGLSPGLVQPTSEPVAAAPTPVPAKEIGQSDEDIAFVTEHMTEAEVFAKYGLLDRAIDHLNKVIERAPDHAPAYERLFQTYLEEGMGAEAGELGGRYVSLLRKQGNAGKANEVENELASRGLSPSFAAIEPEPVEEPAAPVLEEPPQIEMPEELSLEPDVEEISFEEEPEEISLEEEPEEILLEPGEISLELEPEEPAADQVEIEEPEPAPETSEELSLDFDEEGVGLELEETEEPEIRISEEVEEEEPAAAVAPPPAPPTEEELDEIDFYIEQELFDEARERLEVIAVNYPEHPGVRSRMHSLEQKQAAPRAAEPEEPPALDIEAELLSAIPEEEEELAPPPAATAPPPAPAPEVSAEEEEGLFADEDDFFDLAAELEEELEGEMADEISLSEEEQSLEDVFREFKKGVEEQLDAEDHDTHYNLGIAYKEMGLIDEAIGEFQIASKDPKRTVECCSMLGLCFLEKGMPQLAIKWYSKGLEVPEITEEEHLGLLYELANAHVEVGDTTQAHKTFIEIYGVNSNYRDVAERIRQLENVAQ